MSHADPGSFRDESSRVYRVGDRVFRGLSSSAADELAAVMDMAWYQRAVRGGAVIESTRVPAPPADIEDRWDAWLEHPTIPFVTYPFEWTFEMLRDAARLQLELILAGLDEGVMCKDATPYNVQFVGSAPVFIDVGSFERVREGEPWYGYRQFCELYLYPLMFQAYKDLDHHPWLRGSVDGITPDQARRVLSGRKHGRAGILTHVQLHARAQDRFADDTTDVADEIQRAGFKSALVKQTVSKLRDLVEGLEWDRSASEWSGYGDRAHYSDEGLRQKEEFVRGIAEQRSRRLVWDAGANDGRFSRLCVETAELVVAFDVDHLVVDQLYRSLRQERERRIVPLVIDLADLSGGLGWRGRERTVLTDRGSPDLILALALVHHLAITRNVPLGQQVDFFADNAAELVVEFPSPDDPMVRRLRRGKREGLHGDYTIETFESELRRRFEVRDRQPLAGGTRTLYFATRR